MHFAALTEAGKKLWPSLPKFDGFYLAGGTALALQIGHRVSVDFDLFFAEEISPKLLDKVKRTFPNNTVVVSVNNKDELTVFVGSVKLTFIHYPFPVLLPFNNLEGLNLLAVKEIAATKAYTVGRRGSYKDYVDLYFLLLENHITLAEIIALASKKYGPDFNSRLFLEQIVNLEDVGSVEIKFLKDGVTKDTLRAFFEAEVKSLQF